MQRQLHQVSWARGMTEGDVGKETVADIINAEIDRPGSLRPRDELSFIDEASVPNAFGFGYMADPESPGESLSVYLTANGVTIIGDSSSRSIGFGLSLDEASEMVVAGGKIFVAVVSGGEPVGVYTVFHQKADTRFSAPEHYGSHTDANEESISADWSYIGPSETAPEVICEEVDEASYQTDAATALAAHLSNGVHIGYRRIQEFQPSGFAFTESIGVEVFAQFVLRDGSNGGKSETASFSMNRPSNGDDVDTFAVGLTLAVSRSLDPSIGSVNVFRRIVALDGVTTPDAEFELMFTAPLLQSDIEAQLSEATQAHLALIEKPALIYTGSQGGDDFSGMTVLYTTSTFNDSKASRSLDSGSAAYVSGWLEYQTGFMFYWPPVFSADGDLTFRLDDDTDDEQYYEVQYPNAKFLFDNFSGVGAGATVLGGPSQMHDTPHTVGGLSLRPVYNKFGWHEEWGPDIGGAPVFTPDAGTYDVGNAGSTVSDTFTGPSGYQQPVVMFLDEGQVGIISFSDVIGLEIDEVSSVKPRSIAYTGGRVLGLNVVQDDEDLPARMAYTEFRRYSTWGKNNYVDFAPRDDGVGVALASFRNRLLILCSTSSYIYDLSGGSDVSWRKLGEYLNINCVDRRCVAETPVGVFFGDSRYPYYFDGQRLTNIADMGGVLVSQRYREMIASAPRFAWRSDMRQLWIFDDSTNEAMIFDFDRQAWHRHILSENTQDEFLGFTNDANEELAVFASGTGVLRRIRTFEFLGDEDDRPFDWGLDTGEVNMGSSEYVKKLKRIYVDTAQEAATGDLTLTVAGDSEDFTPVSPRGVSRVSTSERGYNVRASLMANRSEGVSWAGRIESLGMSYKPKKLK